MASGVRLSIFPAWAQMLFSTIISITASANGWPSAATLYLPLISPYRQIPNLAREDGEVPTGNHRADLINPIVQQAASLGWMRTSIELAKLHRVVDFLQSLPFVDGQRIGYYGLSYGGYSATWMPPLEPRLQFTINSGFFNDWRQDITAEDTADHYWALPDEDFYNWNVLNRFTHTELVAAMWPRPVCIEWGLQDATTTPKWHKQAWEDLKVKYIGRGIWSIRLSMKTT